MANRGKNIKVHTEKWFIQKHYNGKDYGEKGFKAVYHFNYYPEIIYFISQEVCEEALRRYKPEIEKLNELGKKFMEEK